MSPLRRPFALARLFAVSLLVASATLRPSADTSHASRAPSDVAHRFVCTDYTQGKVMLVESDGRVSWEYRTKQCNDLWVLPNGNVLFNTGRGVREVTREHRIVFDFQSSSEIYACQRLPNGNTFVGECTSGRLLEVAPSGSIVREIRLLPPGAKGGHLYMRNARVLPNGHFLVTHYGERRVCEYAPDGKLLRAIPAEGGPHSAARLPNGNTLISCGDLPGGARIFEVDPAGNTVWQVQGDDLPGISLKFIAGFHRLPNGNTVIANWLGHGQFRKAPHLIEIAPDKRVVWTSANHEAMRTVSSVQILDVAGDPTLGEVYH